MVGSTGDTGPSCVWLVPFLAVRRGASHHVAWAAFMEIGTQGTVIQMTEGSSADHVRRVDADERSSEAVLRAISAATDRPMRELPPLQETLDMDALDQLFDSSATVELLRFEYAGFEVTVEPDRVSVHDRS